MLEQAADAGMAEAALELGYWRLNGQFIRRDLALCRDWFVRAADLGSKQAEPIATALLANGAGGSGRRWLQALDRLARHTDPVSRTQLQQVNLMGLTSDGLPVTEPAYETLADNPEVLAYRRFLTPDECRFLIDLATPMLQPSVVVHPTTGAMVRDPVRTSEVASFPFVLENPFVHAINQRIAAATGKGVEQGEPLQVLRYAPGQEYKLHSDALPGEPNQRVMTFLVYLSDEFEGGATTFPDLQLRFRGEVGDALLFHNVREDGTVHPLARHAGEPVTRGAKFLLSRWIRQRPLDLSGPPGRPL